MESERKIMTQEEKTKFISQKLSLSDQCIQCIEECSELTQVLSKMCRHLSENEPKDDWLTCINNLQEEVADVFVAISVLKKYGIVDMNTVDKIAEKKLERWCNRLRGNWEE